MNKKSKSNTNKNVELDFSFEVKQVNEDSEFFFFEGLGSTFNNKDRDDDVMLKGAFEESLKSMNPALLWQHDMTMPIGVFTEVKETSEGLYVKGKLPKEDTFVSGRVVPQMKVGSVTKMSVGFTIKSKNDIFFENGIRFIKKVTLWEVSLVTIPANNSADVTAMKSIADIISKGGQISFNDIHNALGAKLSEELSEELEGQFWWIVDVFQDYLVYGVEADGKGKGSFFWQDYTIDLESCDLEFIGEPREVIRRVEYIDAVGISGDIEEKLKNKSVKLKHFNINSVFDIKTKREFENTLRESGMFSKSAASFLSSFFQESRRDSGQKNEKSNASLIDELKKLNLDLEK